MNRQTEAGRETHLTDGELFTLAVPPAGEPEALPGHLSECLACSRALLQWKAAARDLAEEDSDTLSRRSPQEWEALEERTLAAIRRSRVGQRLVSWRWLAAIAAGLLLCALALPWRNGFSPSSRPAVLQTADVSAQDQADDALLRDVARLSRGDEGTGGSWSNLAPEPDGSARSAEDRL